GHAEWPINPAGFVIHSAIHAGRDDAICVMHTHTREAQAVAMKASGFSHNSIYAAGLFGRVGYHDFEGLSLCGGERARLLGTLGYSSAVLVMRNHGVLPVGRSIADAFWNMWRFQRSAEAQLRAAAMAGPDIEISDDIRRRCVEDADNFGPNS